MKKARIVVVALAILMLFAAVSCKEPHVHEFGDWTVEKEPTCTETGVEIRTCKGEDCTEKESREIAKLDHEFIEKVDEKYLMSAATEDSPAVYYKSCKVCGAESEETFKYGEKLGHVYGEWKESKPATCTEDGEKTRKCTHEGCNEVETTKIPALGHDFDDWEVKKSATCIEAGEKIHECKREGCVKTETLPIDALGHDFGSDGKCTREGCNAKETSEARIETKYFDTLKAAIESLKTAESKTAEIVVLTDSVKLENFSTITGSSKNSAYNITFVGSGKEKTTIDVSTDYTKPPTEGNHQNYIEEANLSFKDITVTIGDNSNYQGFVRAGSLEFEGCSIVGMGSCWGIGDVVFKNCVFEDNNNDYNLWLYSGSKFVFENCVFNSTAGKFINAYQPSNTTKLVEVVIDGCKFVGETEKYPAIFLKPQTIWKVEINNTECENVKAGSESGSVLYDVRMNEDGVTVKSETTVTIDGVVVWENSAKREN